MLSEKSVYYEWNYNFARTLFITCLILVHFEFHFEFISIIVHFEFTEVIL